MSSPSVSPPSEIHRFVRKISIFTLLPAAPILIAGGICSNIILLPALIPQIISAVFGVYLLANANKESAVKLSTAMLLDIGIGFVNLGLLIPIWIQPAGYWNYGWTEIMLATYGTCFMIINMVIHFYFGAYSAFIRFIDICAHECPSCRARLSEEQDTLLPTTATIKAVGKGPHYSLLGDNVDEAATPRTSEENV